MANTNNQAIKITELDSASNLESGDLVLVAQKVGVNNYLTKKLDASYINNLRTTASNLGSSGAQIYEGSIGGQNTPLTLRFRRIVGGDDVSVSQTGDSIYVSAVSALKVASNAEVWSGMENNKAVSPAGLASKSSSDNAGEYLVKRDYYGNFAANIITASIDGNASTASQLLGERKITMYGDVSGGVRTDFSGDINIFTTLNTNVFGSVLGSKQPVNGVSSLAGLTIYNNVSGVYFNNIPSDVRKFTLVIESWTHAMSAGQGIVQIGTTTEGIITPDAFGVMPADRTYYGNVNSVSGFNGWSITGWGNTTLEHTGIFDFYVATNPSNSGSPKRLICNSKIFQYNSINGQINTLTGVGFINHTGSVNQIILKNAINQTDSRSVVSPSATLYWYF